MFKNAGKFIDLTGQKFGRLTAIKKCGNTKEGKAIWLCTCECGNEVKVIGKDLRRKHTQSCGCLQKESSRSIHYKHGLAKTRINNIYHNMKQRCENKDNKIYGGRGIQVCEEWKNDFQSFYDWAMSNGHTDELTIDRIDVNGNYEPSNCRWVPMKTQQNNRRNNHLVKINNEEKTLSEWSTIYNISINTIRTRLSRKWSDIDAIIVPVRRKKCNLQATHSNITHHIS